jgi:RluA family pseudouridine synthase
MLIERIYEDEDVIVIVKPHGLHSVDDRAKLQQETVRSLMTEYFPEVMMVHRLDAGTGGLMVLAKNPDAHRHLNRQFEKGNVKKAYLALTEGVPFPQSLMLPIASKPSKGRFKINFKSGKNAVTSFLIEKVLSRGAIIKAIPFTGRTHQIRVHLKALKAPLYRDWLYNTDTSPERRVSLFAAELSFLHPASEKKMSFTAALSEYMQGLMKELE